MGPRDDAGGLPVHDEKLRLRQQGVGFLAPADAPSRTEPCKRCRVRNYIKFSGMFLVLFGAAFLRFELFAVALVRGPFCASARFSWCLLIVGAGLVRNS